MAASAVRPALVPSQNTLLNRGVDVGSGQYEPLYGQAGGPPAPGANYGATGAAYVR